MSSLINLGIVIVILIVVSPLIAEYSSTQIDEGIKKQQDADDSKTFGNNPVAGDQVCDTYFRIDGTLDTQSNIIDIFASDDLIVYFDGSDILVEHSNCYTVGNSGSQALSFLSKAYSFHWLGTTPTTLSFATLDHTSTLKPLSILLPANDFSIEMVGKSKTGGGLLTSDINTSEPKKRWVEDVKVESEFFDILIHRDSLPIGFTVEFFLHDVKNDDYLIEFTAEGKRINNQQQGKPYLYDLQAVQFG